DDVRPPADAERRLHRQRRLLVGHDGRVGNHLDQARAERRRRDAETTLLRATLPSKSSCLIVQPVASPVESTRPLMTNSACTPPSREPSGLNLKRASRTGPCSRRNEGTVLRAPNAVATATCGFTAGLVPPTAGCV